MEADPDPLPNYDLKRSLKKTHKATEQDGLNTDLFKCGNICQVWEYYSDYCISIISVVKGNSPVRLNIKTTQMSVFKKLK